METLLRQRAIDGRPIRYGIPPVPAAQMVPAAQIVPVAAADRGAGPEAIKRAMRRLAGGVVVITAGIGEERVGLTATSAVSLSVDPPTMLVCVNRTSSSLPVILRRRHFCVSVLGAEHQAVAERFAGIGPAGQGVRGAARYHGAEWVRMASGASGLGGAQALIDCDLAEVIERHSHAILLGAVREVRTDGPEAASLVYRSGRFVSLPLA